MKYNRTVSKTINEIVRKYYSYSNRYGDGRKNNMHRIKYTTYRPDSLCPRPSDVQAIRKDLLEAGINVNVRSFISKCYYPRMTHRTLVIHLDKDNC